jgi:hypothetical protein
MSQRQQILISSPATTSGESAVLDFTAPHTEVLDKLPHWIKILEKFGFEYISKKLKEEKAYRKCESKRRRLYFTFKCTACCVTEKKDISVIGKTAGQIAIHLKVS